MSTTEIGRQTEAVVSEYVRCNGMTVLERNYRTRNGEIDIIARDGNCLVFIEVKKMPASWEESDISRKVDLRKRHRIRMTASEYISNNREMVYYCTRFDVASVCGNTIKYYKGAF